MSSSKKYRAAVIGTGRIGMLHEDDPKRLKPATHVGMWVAHPEVDLIAVCDADESKFDMAERLQPGVATYTDPSRLLEEQKPDVVSIATWRDTHYDMMDLCLRHNVRVICCEKPIAETNYHAREIVERAKKQRVELLINHRRRFDQLLYQFRDNLKDGLVGELLQVSTYYVFGLITTATHLVDAMRFLLKDIAGEVVWVSGHPFTIKHFAPEDDPGIDGFIGFESGLKVSIQCLSMKDFDHFEFRFYGRKGMARLFNIGRDIEVYDVIESPEHLGFAELSTEPYQRWGGKPRDQFSYMADNAIACLKGTQTSLSTGEDSLKALEILNAMRKSAAENGQVIHLASNSGKS